MPPLPKGLDEHTVRQYWERDVEQYRALQRAGYQRDALRQVFGAKYGDVVLGAVSGAPLAGLPAPSARYINALADELDRRPR
jgi:hypothetical protein